jgi:hypothetical protein
MNKKQLIQSLQTIYNRELLDLMENRCVIKLNDRGDSPKYQKFELALDLFSSIGHDEALKKTFTKFVKDNLLNSDETMGGSLKYEPVSTIRLSFFILVHLKMVDEAIKILKRRILKGKTFYIIISNIGALIKYYKYHLNHDQLTDLVEPIKKHLRTPVTANVMDHALKMISSIKFEEVCIMLEGTNSEINKDKEKVTQWFDTFQFEPGLSEFLNNLDNFLRSNDKNIASGMINNFRNFMSGFIENLAEKILSIENKPLPKSKDAEGKTRTDIGKCRVYIKEKLELSDRDDLMFDAFVKILHTEGGHSMVSTKEYLRLTRNIGIEIVLFLLTRYKEKYP